MASAENPVVNIEQDFVSQVVEFNKRVLKIEGRPLGLLPKNEFEITMKCLKEELEEFEEAYRLGDMVGCIDAIVDLRYFAIGVLHKKGLTPAMINKCDTAVHEANMEKKLGQNAKRAIDGAADAVKPEGWISPEARIEAILDEVPNDHHN